LALAGVLALTLAAASAYGAPFAYVTGRSDVGNDAVSQYDIGLGGLLAPLSPPTVTAGQAPQGVAVSPDGRSVYVANASFGPPFGQGNISQYDVRADGTLKPKHPPTVFVGGGTPDGGPTGIAVSPDGKSVYVTACAGGAFQLDVAADGTLSLKDPPGVPIDNCPLGVAVSPNGESVYITNFQSGVISQYDVGPGGKLSPKDPPVVHDGGGAPEGIAVSPDSQSVYVADWSSATVSQFDVGPGGALSLKDPPTAAAGERPVDVAVSPDGTSVYVADRGSDRVSQYDVGADGALSPKRPRTVDTDDDPWGLAVSADGRSVYVANRLSDDVSQYDVGPDGTLSPKSQPTVPATDGPSAIAVSTHPTRRAQCRHAGWRRYGFRNRRQCARSVKHA
jgi:DNA-binding beta-propeller fold protein YncE